MPRIALDPVLAIHPGHDLLEELGRIALSDTELSNPHGLVEGLVEGLQVVLEVLGLVPGVVVGDDVVDLAVGAAGHELLQPVDALVGAVAVGHRWGTDLQVAGEGLDVLLVGLDGVVDGHAGATATVSC